MSITFTGHRHWIEYGSQRSCSVFRSDEQHEGETDDATGDLIPNPTYVAGCALNLANGNAHRLLDVLGLGAARASDGAIEMSVALDALTDFMRYGAVYPGSGPLYFQAARLYALALLSKARGATHIHYC